MSVRDIARHLSELYGTEIGRDTISRVTDAVLEDVADWRSRPLATVYPIVYFDCLMVRVREDRSVSSRACYLAIGQGIDGDREVLGIWWQETEGAKFWLAVLNDLRQRGVHDVLIACVDGLTGFPEAIEAVFPHAWVQTCIVHQIRSSMRYTNSIENLNRQIRKAIKTCGHFPDDKPPPSSSTSPSNAPRPPGSAPTTGHPRSEPQNPLRRPTPRLTPTNHPTSHTEGRTVSLALGGSELSRGSVEDKRAQIHMNPHESTEIHRKSVGGPSRVFVSGR
jgi:hypothetical protein